MPKHHESHPHTTKKVTRNREERRFLVFKFFSHEVKVVNDVGGPGGQDHGAKGHNQRDQSTTAATIGEHMLLIRTSPDAHEKDVHGEDPVDVIPGSRERTLGLTAVPSAIIRRRGRRIITAAGPLKWALAGVSRRRRRTKTVVIASDLPKDSAF